MSILNQQQTNKMTAFSSLLLLTYFTVQAFVSGCTEACYAVHTIDTCPPVEAAFRQAFIDFWK